MYRILFLNFIVFAFVNISIGQSSNIVETEFKVSGNCGMCQVRIENAALIKGVKKAVWDKENQSLKVIYRSDKVEILDIHKAVAKAGHDTSIIKAEDAVYSKIPYCCSYRENPNVH